MSNTNAWVDTGFLIALFARNDRYHASATQFLQNLGKIRLHTLWPVVTEACFFLDNQGKQALLRWIERGGMDLHEITPQELPAIRKILEKYDNLCPDFTDAALVAFAGILGIKPILTVDERDFSVYRLPDGGAFERLWV